LDMKNAEEPMHCITLSHIFKCKLNGSHFDVLKCPVNHELVLRQSVHVYVCVCVCARTHVHTCTRSGLPEYIKLSQ
jgi:hypothetical protein